MGSTNPSDGHPGNRGAQPSGILNQLMGHPIPPVGVIPVTAAVIEIQ